MSNGENITIHYQYNKYTGKAYDIKFVTPQRKAKNPDEIFNEIKRSLK